MRCQACIHCACDPVSDDGPHASHTYRMSLNTTAVAPPRLTPPQTVRRAVRWEYVAAMGARHGLCVVQAKPAWAHLCCSQTERCNARVQCRIVLQSGVCLYRLDVDVCKVCGGIGSGAEGVMAACMQCCEVFHPFCLPEHASPEPACDQPGFR